jgi:hypothetical protein
MPFGHPLGIQLEINTLARPDFEGQLFHHAGLAGQAIHRHPLNLSQ